MSEATLLDELNTFYVPLDLLNKDSAVKSTLPPEYWPLSVTTVVVRKILLRLNINITAGPDNLSGHVLKTLTNQLADITADIFNNSHKTVPSCLKRAIIVTATKQCLVRLGTKRGLRCR